MSFSRRTIGNYEIERDLAEGGMGVVRLGRQAHLDRPVVVKTLRRALAQDAQVEERFLREARAAAAVHHQNVVAVYDCFTWRGERFIVQEYVEGADLAKILRTVPQIAPRVACLIGLELARGLEEIHALGIIHRDVKPSNVIISREGATKIADFGIAIDDRGPGLTQTGHAVGTPRYMAPEQLLGEAVDARSDLFAFGVLLYEMLTGEEPFGASETNPGQALLRRIEAGRYSRVRAHSPATPRSLARLVQRCLNARPRRRFASTTHLRRALERQLGAIPPGECRAEISKWLWDHGVFQLEEGETISLSTPQETLPRRRRAAGWIAAAGVATAATALAAGWIDVGAWSSPGLTGMTELVLSEWGDDPPE